MNKIILCLISILILSGCDTVKTEFQISDLKDEIAELKEKNENLSLENRDLTAQVARLNVGNLGGAEVEEMRKALTKKEAELNLFESRLTKREESIKTDKTNLDMDKKQFIDKNGDKLEAIGEARQLKTEYEFMREKYNDAEARANNWLIYISILIVAFVITIFVTIHKSMKYSAKNSQIDTAVRIIEASGIDNKDKRLLMSTFERLDDQSDKTNS